MNRHLRMNTLQDFFAFLLTSFFRQRIALIDDGETGGWRNSFGIDDKTGGWNESFGIDWGDDSVNNKFLLSGVAVRITRTTYGAYKVPLVYFSKDSCDCLRATGPRNPRRCITI